MDEKIDGRASNGGSRPGAGAKKKSIVRKQNQLRATPEEWAIILKFATELKNKNDKATKQAPT